MRGASRWLSDPLRVSDAWRIRSTARHGVAGEVRTVTPSGRDALVVMVQAAHLGDFDHGATIGGVNLPPST
jgi:hypothetical protein